MTVEEEMRIQHRLGEKKGFAEGQKSGAAQEKREIAKNLKSLKLPMEQIKAATGLSVAKLKHCRKTKKVKKLELLAVMLKISNFFDFCGMIHQQMADFHRKLDKIRHIYSIRPDRKFWA